MSEALPATPAPIALPCVGPSLDSEAGVATRAAGLVDALRRARRTPAVMPAEIAEGLKFARTKPTILLVFGITVVTNAFAFAYSGLLAPLGLGAFHVSPSLVGVLAAGAMLHEPLGWREISALVFTLGGVALALRS